MKATDLISSLERQDLTFLTGVPCSYLDGLLVAINDQPDVVQHVMATSEGEAVGIAAGYYLSAGKVPIVYMQNSGLGNAVNPLTSLMDKDVYSIPCILFLSWRGEPGYSDEPQHKKMGRIMPDLLKDMDIHYEFASQDSAKTTKNIEDLKAMALNQQKPVALIFRPKLIDMPELHGNKVQPDYMLREEIIKQLLPRIGESPIITTTGKTSREVFELREQQSETHQYDFLTVGSMGCAAGIGLGVALQTSKKVFVIDGDGAVLMKMGTLATIGHYQPKNFVHIVIDNSSYESTGGQPTASTSVQWYQLFTSVNYQKVTIIRTADELAKLDFNDCNGPQAVVIYAKTGSRADLGRPTTTPLQNRNEFMNFLREPKL